MICEGCDERADQIDDLYFDTTDEVYLCDHCAYEKYGEAEGWDRPT